MQFFIIRHKPTGRIFEQRRSGERGYTHDDPGTCGRRPPRLFTTRRGAENALTVWLQGKITVLRREYDEDWRIQPVPERRREEYEVTEVSLEIKG